MALNYRFLDLEVDLQQQKVRRDGQSLNTQGLGYQLFFYLPQSENRAVSVDEVIEYV